MTLVRMTSSVATRYSAFGKGDVLQITGKIPSVIAQNSEPFVDNAPADVKNIDAAEFARVHRPREKPVIPPPLTEGQVLTKMGWDTKQLAVARASLGFPAPRQRFSFKAFKAAPSNMPVWAVDEIDAWRSALSAVIP